MKMKVYLVEYSDYDTHFVVGVYSTKENAEEAVTKDLKKNKYFYREDYIITRIMLDKGF